MLPAGRYVIATHIGPYDGLVGSNAELQSWAEERRLIWAMQQTDAGEAWDGRVEVYVTDPGEEPNPERWHTELRYLLADC